MLASPSARPGQTAGDEFLAKLRSGDFDVQTEAIESLTRLQEAEVRDLLPLIVDATRDRSAEVRIAALEAFCQVDPELAQPYLAELGALIVDREWSVREAAVNALASAGPGSLPHLARAAKDADRRVRRAAVQALGRLGASPPVQALLVRALRDPSELVRWNAASVLGSFGTQAQGAAPELGRLLGDTSELVRYHAARSLWQAGAGVEAAVPVLIGLLSSPEASVRHGSAFVLGELGPRAGAAVPALRKLLGDASPDVRTMAATAVEKIQRAPR